MKSVDNQRFSSNTFDSRFSIDYTDQNQSMSGSGHIKILKDSIIWGSINFLRIPVVKFYITPHKIQYYNKLQQEYYDGDFNLIKEQFGIDLSFDNIQNLLLGDLITDISDGDYDLDIQKNYYTLNARQPVLLQAVKIAPFFKILSEKLGDSSGRELSINYADYQYIENSNLPKKISIKTLRSNNDLQIDLEYKNISINKALRFPFKIPTGYKPIRF